MDSEYPAWQRGFQGRQRGRNGCDIWMVLNYILLYPSENVDVSCLLITKLAQRKRSSKEACMIQAAAKSLLLKTEHLINS